MDIKTAFELVRERHKEPLKDSFELDNVFAFILDTKTDIDLIVCVDKKTSEILYTNIVGLDMMIRGIYENE